MMGAVRARLPSVLAAAGVLLAACTSGSSPEPSDGPTTPPTQQMQAQVASVDLYVDAPQRVGVGLFLGDGRIVTFGEVSFRFAFTGTTEQEISPRPGPEATASYIPTPGTPDGSGQGPTMSQPTDARGVYEAEDVTFSDAGIWTVRVTADLDGGAQTAASTFQVEEQPQYPAPGQTAMPTENLTIGSKGVPKAAIDSRYTISGKIPDPELHTWTIAEAIAQHRPALVVFSTPVYCISRFCGPVTNLVDRLAKKYADRAVFIQVEIYRECCTKIVVNQAAADWVYRNGDVTEPWVFLIGSDGTILDRWSSLFSANEISAELERLPPMPPGPTPTP
jgi:hypothetical protein